MWIEVVRARLEDLSLLMEWRMRILREDSHTACFARDRGTGEIAGCSGICC